MRTLILSCNTGAGHNSCAKAIREIYEAHGEVCQIADALEESEEKIQEIADSIQKDKSPL